MHHKDILVTGKQSNKNVKYDHHNFLLHFFHNQGKQKGKTITVLSVKKLSTVINILFYIDKYSKNTSSPYKFDVVRKTATTTLKFCR